MPVLIMRTSKKAQHEQGFAYIWTLMLVAFMGVGLALAGEVYSTSAQRDKERQLLSIGREFRNAIAMYYETNQQGGQRQYPATLDELIKDPRFPHTRRYLRRIYIDPMTGRNEWGLVYVKGRIAGIHSLSDRKPIKQGNFEANEAGFRGAEKYSEWVFSYPFDVLVIESLAKEAEIGLPKAMTSEALGAQSQENVQGSTREK